MTNSEESLASILDQFGSSPLPDAVPLLVTEGDAPSKRASIQQSDYLSFALTQFAERKGPLVLFGHSLSKQDSHIIEAIDQGPRHEPRLVAIGLRPGNPDLLRQRQLHYQHVLPYANLRFFDATTHPLGLPTLCQG